MLLLNSKGEFIISASSPMTRIFFFFLHQFWVGLRGKNPNILAFFDGSFINTVIYLYKIYIHLKVVITQCQTLVYGLLGILGRKIKITNITTTLVKVIKSKQLWEYLKIINIPVFYYYCCYYYVNKSKYYVYKTKFVKREEFGKF